jgi:DNA-binding NtrC family response regulator
MASVDQTASRIGRLVEREHDGASAYLLVLQDDSSSIFHLPRSGEVVIGRAADAELRVQHSSVSRRHATLRIDASGMRVADLGSHNGTRVNNEPIDGARMLASGDVIAIGDVVLVVHFSEPATVSRQIYDEPGWLRRLAEELERAMTFGRSLAVVAILDATPAALTALADDLRLIDAVGVRDDGQALLLLPEVDRVQARALVERAQVAANALVPTRVGLALCPNDAIDSDTLLLAARGAARGANPGCIVEAAEAGTRLELGPRRVWLADPAIIRVFALLERLAASELPVLITGETGVGKENAAYAVHHWSKRTGPFIAVNCAAIGPESLIESELYGHDKGAFTGATAAKPGLFESAAGGTIFLDEVGELPLAIQAKLLRTLEAKTVTRLGESRERPIDARVVAATNRSLVDEAATSRFRQDLYFRLSGATVIVPPLRDRRCEIPLLARALLAEACARTQRAPMTFTPEAMQVLLAYPWPGNVRELRNTVEYVMVAAPDDHVEPSDLPEHLGGTASPPIGLLVPQLAAVETKNTFRPLAEELRELERQRMSEALAAAGGVKTRAAQLIDMPIRTFTLRLKQHKL